MMRVPNKVFIQHSERGSAGWRLVVILFAAAVVAIAAHPYRKKIASLIKPIEERIRSLEVSDPPRRSARPKRLLEDLDSPVKVQGEQVIPRAAEPKKLDKLTTEDREGLSNLVDSLASGKAKGKDRK